MCMCAPAHVGPWVEARGQFSGVGALLPPCRSWGWHSGHQLGGKRPYWLTRLAGLPERLELLYSSFSRSSWRSVKWTHFDSFLVYLKAAFRTGGAQAVFLVSHDLEETAGSWGLMKQRLRDLRVAGLPSHARGFLSFNMLWPGQNHRLQVKVRAAVHLFLSSR